MEVDFNFHCFYYVIRYIFFSKELNVIDQSNQSLINASQHPAVVFLRKKKRFFQITNITSIL